MHDHVRERTLAEGIELLDRCHVVFFDRMAMLNASVNGHPGAAAYDAVLVQGGEHDSTTERAALERDEARDARRRIDHLLRTLMRMALDLTDELSHWAPADSQLELDLERPKAGQGTCECCGAWVSGTSDTKDRLVAGYCFACYERWRYRGKPERSAFNAEGRRLRDVQMSRTRSAGQDT